MKLPTFRHEQAVSPDPSVGVLSLPRMVILDADQREALTVAGPPPGMYAIDPSEGSLRQWVMDHWEVVGRWVQGDADDPLGNWQIAAQRSWGFIPGVAGIGVGNGTGGGGTSGGGGVSPAPAPTGSPSITQPSFPFTPQCETVMQNPDPGAIGAGRFWFDTGSSQLFIRNTTNTAWIEICLC